MEIHLTEQESQKLLENSQENGGTFTLSLHYRPLIRFNNSQENGGTFTAAFLCYVSGSFGNFITNIVTAELWILSVILYFIGFGLLLLSNESKEFFSGGFSFSNIKNKFKRPLVVVLFIAIIVAGIFTYIYRPIPDIAITSPISNSKVKISEDVPTTVKGTVDKELSDKKFLVYLYKFDENKENQIHMIAEPTTAGEWEVQINLQPGKNVLVAVAVNDARRDFFDKVIYQSKDVEINAILLD